MIQPYPIPMKFDEGELPEILFRSLPFNYIEEYSLGGCFFTYSC